MGIVEELKQRFARRGREIERINEMRKGALNANHANKKVAADMARDDARETMSQRAFVRAFGDKVVRYRLSYRADFIGLLIVGKYQGILVTGHEDGTHRKLRIVDVGPDGRLSVTGRCLTLKDNESISNLQRGLLRWVR